MARAIALLLATILALVAGACGAGASASPTAALPTTASGSLTVTGAWVRAAAAGADSAAYFSIVNGLAADDMLTGLKQALNPGDQVRITPSFQNTGAITVTAEGRAN